MKWLSEVPKNCQVCDHELKNQFVDGATGLPGSRGPWAIQCTKCFAETGLTYGIGKGQLYDLKTRECLKGGREK